MPSSPNLEWKQFKDLELRFPDWIIEGLLPAESMLCLYGKRGQGKTFLGIDWACSIATGKNWLDKYATNRGRVAYLLAERPQGLKRRMIGWLRHKRLSEDEGSSLLDEGDGYFFVAQGQYLLDTKEDQLRIITGLKSLENLSLLVIDPLVAFMKGSENDTREMQNFVDGVRRIVEELHCSVLLVHHEGKGNFNNSLGARGSSALEAGLDTVLYLGGKNSPQTLEVTKQRDAKSIAPLHLQFIPVEGSDNSGHKRELGMFPVAVEAPPKTEEKPKKNKREEQYGYILSAIAELEENLQEPTIKEIAPMASKHGIKPSTLRNRLGELVDQGRLSEDTTKAQHIYRTQHLHEKTETTESERAAAA